MRFTSGDELKVQLVTLSVALAKGAELGAIADGWGIALLARLQELGVFKPDHLFLVTIQNPDGAGRVVLGFVTDTDGVNVPAVSAVIDTLQRRGLTPDPESEPAPLGRRIQ